jgi:hypothetical protein
MTDLSVADVLDRAADLIEPEGAWSDGDVARDRSGNATYSMDPGAVCWCALGAIWREAEIAGINRYASEIPMAELVGGSVAIFNDAPGRTQAEVVAKLREAASLARDTSHVG